MMMIKLIKNLHLPNSMIMYNNFENITFNKEA